MLVVRVAWMVCSPDRLSVKMGIFAPCCHSTNSSAEKISNKSASKTELFSSNLQAVSPRLLPCAVGCRQAGITAGPISENTWTGDRGVVIKLCA